MDFEAKKLNNKPDEQRRDIDKKSAPNRGDLKEMPEVQRRDNNIKSEAERHSLNETLAVLAEKTEEVYSSDRRIFIETFGCQQNTADSEKIMGMFGAMGFKRVLSADEADVIVLNTCAVRNNAELKVLGKVGALKHIKQERPDTTIILTGCMMQQQHISEEIRKKYRHVDIVCGTLSQSKLPELFLEHLGERERVFSHEDSAEIVENIPTERESKYTANITIINGCNNFCTYCIVPYVRGRERSRRHTDILTEIEGLVKQGYKEFTLLGQNVNSYGKDRDDGVDFSDLLEKINATQGEFLIRFLTSHPKDATEKLFSVMASCEKVARHLHLPVQSGSSRVLKAMNRRYTREHYLDLISLARQYMPDIVITSDIIVGFPGETYDDFLETLSLVKEVRFDSVFSFIYSPRKGTPAELLPDIFTRQEKQKWFDMLKTEQDKISKEINDTYLGTVQRVLCEGASKTDIFTLTGRTQGLKVVNFKGKPDLQGRFIDVKITKAQPWSLFGEII